MDEACHTATGDGEALYVIDDLNHPVNVALYADYQRSQDLGPELASGLTAEAFFRSTCGGIRSVGGSS